MDLEVLSVARPRLQSFDDWQSIVADLTFAFQPITNVHTGATYGFEALLRGVEAAGFAGISAFFDAAFDSGRLFDIDIALRRKAVGRFAGSAIGAGAKLFYNIDNRLGLTALPDTAHTAAIMADYGLPNSSFCFELSERHQCCESNFRLTKRYQDQAFRVAIDDFGSGYSGLQLLYDAEPEIIKIDRFLVEAIDRDPKKRVMLATVVNMAHIMGMSVVAEGVETEQEFRACRDAGADYVQGYLIARPTTDTSALRSHYPLSGFLVVPDRRNGEAVDDLVARKMEFVEPIKVTDSIVSVLDRFRTERDKTLFPVINERGEAEGVLREADLKHYVYSPFGLSLLQNRNYPKNILSFTTPAPVVDIHARMEKVVEAYAINEAAEAVIITDNGGYCGILRSRALIEAINERRIEQARDQNPLSRLRGNRSITEYLAHALNRSDGHVFVYLDFNNFKAFNDRYGFRLGDRAILVFADMLRDVESRTGLFAGHIGGDDFFLGIPAAKMAFDEALAVAKHLIAEFAVTARAFYTDDDRERGYIVAKGRDGRTKRFPLLSVSAAALVINNPAVTGIDSEQLSERIAELKSTAKHHPEGLAFAIV